MKAAMFLLLGLLFLWAGITGRLGITLAAIFTPSEVLPNGRG
jgi:hypothetical protein